MNGLNRICAITYEAAILLLLVLAVLAPFHAASTDHFIVVQSLDERHAILAGDVSRLTVGQAVPLYRFSRQWKAPIGEAVVQSIRNGEADIAVSPQQMSWPLGRHAKLGRTDTGELYAVLGGSRPLNPGDTVNIFRREVFVASLYVARIETGRSYFFDPGNLGDISGLHASEYSIVTQAADFSSAPMYWIESFVIALSLLGYALFYAFKKRSPFTLAGDALRRIPISRTVLDWTINLLLGIPFAWFMTTMPLYLVAHLASWLAENAFGQTLFLRPVAEAIMPFAFVLECVAYYAYLFWMRRSPVLAFWRFISYKGRGVVKEVNFKRGFIMWTLHLAIVYAFARTLIDFLDSDIEAVIEIGRNPSSPEAVFEMLKYAIWAVTVVGVLVGYGHSVVSILWGKYIRNLDFTVTGWLTNAFCYPFLGVVIWQLIPPFTGSSPIITAGPLQMLMLVLGLVLNLLYMLTILNLGTLFDLMADKGVRVSLFYSTVRHPSYTLEVAMFFVTELVGLTFGLQWLAITMYFFIYWIRSEREDNFMEHSNPDYAPYQADVPYKFIPGIY